ncbi:hypothetical protein AYI70_g22 [Smittium culicis]|uniref:Uncharacterized protein n=1 Tax=Smittium culicis TaxID=133412 RepID=A0A1R1YIH7_9FUNG|nr:hypothetical protein AYI70_g22 [Smittium culicis]
MENKHSIVSIVVTLLCILANINSANASGSKNPINIEIGNAGLEVRVKRQDDLTPTTVGLASTVSAPNILSSISKKINTRTVAKTTTLTTKTTINTLDRKKSTTAADEGSKEGSPDSENQSSSSKQLSKLPRSTQTGDDIDSTNKLKPDNLITTMTKSISSDAVETDAFGSTITVVNVVYQVEVIEQEVDEGVTLGYTKIDNKVIASISYSNGDISYLYYFHFDFFDIYIFSYDELFLIKLYVNLVFLNLIIA